MRKYFLSVVLMFFIYANIAFAQKTAEQRADKQTKALTKKLGLSADQSKQIYDINLAIDKQADEVRKQPKDKKGGRRDKILQLNKDRENQILAVLTPDQKTKYEQWKTNKKTKRMNRK